MNKENLGKFINRKRAMREMININPLQTGGILTKEAKDALSEWSDGYAVCDFCSGQLEEIRTPPIFDFVQEALPKFIGADIVRITHGAREGMFAIIHALTKPGDSIIIDGNAHYTTYLAAERNGLNIIEAPHSGYPEYKIETEKYGEIIKKSKETKITLLVLTWPDGNYGNLPEVKKLAKIAAEYKIPLLINAAYAIGRMPINLNEIGADFIIGSGHKSMASSGPIGFVGMKKEWKEIIFKKSRYFKTKEVEMLGCSVRGVPIMTLMASFPYVVDRVKEWEKQKEKARWFSQEMEKLGIKQLGEKPHNHDLMFFESKKLYEISKKHKQGSFFLYKELKKRNIWGIRPGMTKHFKLSTFAASQEDLTKVIKVFRELLKST